MHRALWEFRIRGVATNLRFLDQIITHPRFARGDYTTRFIDETPELFAGAGAARPRHAHAELPGGDSSSTAIPRSPAAPSPDTADGGAAAAAARGRGPPQQAPPGSRQRLEQLGPAALRALDAAASSACCSPTPPCAMRISRCWRRACAPSTCSRSRRPMRRCCPDCSRSNAGAGRPSTSPCAS